MKKLGFGCMRLPVVDGQLGQIDRDTFTNMVDRFMEKGFSYFDTAWFYCSGTSEEAVRECLVKRYPRDAFQLADKMPMMLVKEKDDLESYFQEQLARCGVEYFDYYLLHDMGKGRLECADRTNAFDFLAQKKAEGRIRNVGFSFHDTADVLDEILSTHPEMEFVQLQLNYLDWESVSIQSRQNYEVARKHGKPVIVMEPVKGGTLVTLPSEAQDALAKVHPKWSNVAWALRFAASHEDVMMVLSGMGDVAQVEENMTTLEDARPFTLEERQAVAKAAQIVNSRTEIPCTSCAYCITVCPTGVDIPRCFSLFNEDAREITDKLFTAQSVHYIHLKEQGKNAGECIGCGKCEQMCPQHLPIRQLLKDVAQKYENN